uniref:Uncharacterized protein n=1 Tax=Toxoplasma gondii COUG TaxID=1074873 RepID=A0A2G8YCR4_TOXGO|nr:hypothetical protein TGCOUG_362010 [Toxoplasma gondii COUG]
MQTTGPLSGVHRAARWVSWDSVVYGDLVFSAKKSVASFSTETQHRKPSASASPHRPTRGKTQKRGSSGSRVSRMRRGRNPVESYSSETSRQRLEVAGKDGNKILCKASLRTEARRKESTHVD